MHPYYQAMRRIIVITLTCVALIAGMLSLVTAPATATPATPAVAAKKAKKKKKVSARKLLKQLKVKPEKKAGSYKRARFPHWSTKKGCNTRHSVLKRYSKTTPTIKGTCTVTAGRWVDEYTKKVYRKASDLHIDHRVALSEAWRSGAHNWKPVKRKAFANDLGYRFSLLPVGATVNIQKSDYDPAQWMPPKKQCAYVARWVAVKKRWKLKVDRPEKRAIRSVMKGCKPKQLRVIRPKVWKRPAKAGKKAGNKASGNTGKPAASGSVRPASEWNCPGSHPIKGNENSWIYHVPGGAYYSRTKPEQCFATESAAVAAGFRKSMR